MANSLEGAKIRATTSLFSGLDLSPLAINSFSLSIVYTRGTVKARVFPEPVQAFTQTSLFERKRGITVFCTFEILSKPKPVLIVSIILGSS